MNQGSLRPSSNASSPGEYDPLGVLHDFNAPKARSMSAQGNALGFERKKSQALRGRPIDRGMPQSLARIYLHLISVQKTALQSLATRSATQCIPTWQPSSRTLVAMQT